MAHTPTADVTRVPITLGSMPREALFVALRKHGVRHNAYFEAIRERLVIAERPHDGKLVITTVGALGAHDGATLDTITTLAAARGLRPCPLEAALHLVLAWNPVGPRVTVVSPRPEGNEDEEGRVIARGLYLRRDAEGLWLRGFAASDDWMFEAEEHVALLDGDVSPDSP